MGNLLSSGDAGCPPCPALAGFLEHRRWRSNMRFAVFNRDTALGKVATKSVG
ncbi:hypothetical protein [Pseudopelagicola sp. nBUS_19]|uniref:hypothetical protein n=1 Tax=unclassified Pseudopelagicola TaxID=2649563 RepID=UPI003EBE3132